MVWYYADGNNQRGPVSDEEFDDLVARGRVHEETLVWQDGMPDWCPLSKARDEGYVKAVPVQQPSSHGYPITPPAVATETPHQVTSTERCANCGRTYPPEEVSRFANVPVCRLCQPAVIDSVRRTTGTSVTASANKIPYITGSTTAEHGRVLPRLVARLIDNFLISLLAVLTFFMFFDTSGLQAGITPDMTAPEMRPLLFMWVAFEAIYHAVFVAAMAATPGKMIFRLRVAQSNGGRVAAHQAVVRAFSLAFLQALSLLWPESTLALIATFAQIAAFAVALYNRQRRTAFDFAASTVVLKS